MSSQLESYETHSGYQVAVYLKSVVYLGLNMMVVPALSFNTENSANKIASLWSFISKRHFNLTKLLSDFYIGGSNMFFVSLMI